MLAAVFCLRLACGLTAALLLVDTASANPRFFRAQYRIVLGLTSVAALLAWPEASLLWRGIMITAIVCAMAGALSWSLASAPGAGIIVAMTLGCLGIVLALVSIGQNRSVGPLGVLANEYSSAALLGSATTAMLMGHSYLNAPSTAIKPLLSLLCGMFISAFVRLGVAATGACYWTAGHSLANLDTELLIWVPVRWMLGFGGPLGLGLMAWQTAKARSTQSATGILYVVVILTFLGELTGQLLFEQTGCLS
jgi:hypothetical protein